ncbi:unnamed protein product [Microthlaspi erraticum]|uniref:Uncharacterized protein n=1 Tax=Microthlaspi erraticum TaxID=1685480 RepID=A0A6D2KY77_9BRAS|nr:unnamed protein product [Microthlaspi erraticum]
MDFIKTSSLRALIELTFQRNWNGFIWMSRKGVIAKRVKAAPDGYIENQRPNAQSGWPRNECSALGQNHSVRLSLGQSPTTRPITQHDPGNMPAVGQATTPRHNRARPKRASREVTPRGRATHLTYRPTLPSEPGTSLASGRRPSANLIRPTTPADRHNIRPDRSDSAKDPTVRPTVPTTVRTPRSTRSRF